MISPLLHRRQMLKALSAATLGAAGPSLLGGRAAFAVEGRTLKIRNDGDIRNLDPATRGGWYDETVMFAIFSGLVRYKAGDEWGWQPDAAESIDAADPLAIPFRLRPGMTWSNGFGAVTAEDVKYSYERFADPKVNAVYASDWAALDGVEVTGPQSGIIHLKKPFAPLFTSTLPHASGLIVCKAAVEKNGGTIGTDPLATSGPYRLSRWQPAERITLTRNPDWSGPQPYFDEIQLYPVADRTAAETAFDAGDLDVTQIAISSIEQRQGGKADLTVKPALAYTWMGMNIENPKLADVRVRRAIQRAINVPEVIDATFGGAVQPAHGIIPPPLLGARDALLYPYDAGAAKALLAEAGVDGLRLKLEFGTDADLLVAAQVIQVQLAQVGITLDVRQMDDATLTAQQQDKEGGTWKEIELFFITFTTAPDPSWVTEWFKCDQVGVWNFQRTCDAAWDEANAKAAEEADPAKRAAMYVDLQNELEETGAYVFLYHGVNAWLSPKGLKGAWTPDGQWALLREFAAA
ncbi:ABC transporter substrate-binding protein [Azospirillum sp. ST 5-10]|uniref:ABC transporter substrate-binding protein n=1 Tax=unclassified Azospirillum TaxID=2630922 RepID=UPI003F4A0359